MNQDQPSRDEIEARITALLLGELPADEARLLRWTISQDPALMKLQAELASIIVLVREAAKTPATAAGEKEVPLKLADERRAKLLAHFKTSRPRPADPLFWLKRIELSRIQVPRLLTVLAVLAIVAVLTAMLLPALSKAKNKSIRVSQLSAAKQRALEQRMQTEDKNPAVATTISVASAPAAVAPEPVLAPPPAPIYLPSTTAAGAPELALNDRRQSFAASGQLWSGNTATPRGAFGPVTPATPTASSESFANRLNSPTPHEKPAEFEFQQPSSFYRNRTGGGSGGGGASGGAADASSAAGLAAVNGGDAWKTPAGDFGLTGSDALAKNSLPESGPLQTSGLRQTQMRATEAQPAITISGSKQNATASSSLDGIATDSAVDGDTARNGFGLNKDQQSRGMLLTPPAAAPAKPSSIVTAGTLRIADEISAGQAGGQTRAIPAVTDTVPVLGEVPTVGRLFKSLSDGQPVASPAPVIQANLAPGSPALGVAGEALQSGRTKDDVGRLSYFDNFAPAPTLTQEQLRTYSNQHLDLAGKKEEAKEKDQAAAVKDQSYWEAKRKLANMIDLHKLLAAKIESEKVNMAIPNNPFGEIKALQDQYDQEEQGIRLAQAEVNRLAKESSVEQADIAIPKPVANAPVPQPEILTRENNFSTFSLNVSDVSFKLAAASLERGQMPDAASIRSEEFINAFDYHDPEAAAGQPLAFTSERARYPFAQNRDLLRFSIKTAAAGRPAGRALNLVLLLDNSGSMERADRVAIIREALRVLATQLQPQDTVSVVTFARTARLWADGVRGNQAGETLAQVGGITPEGGTNLEEAMKLAYATARRHYLVKGMNRVVLLTDGAANLGDVNPAALEQMVEAQRKQGIALDCFGVGSEDFNDDLLEQLSSNGDGRYAFLNSPADVAGEFAAKLAGALQIAASDVKVQVEFNPQRVIAYRQIGYAKHQLAKQQFRDNTVDAAEIAAQETGNALYIIETKADGIGPIATVRVRYKIPGTTDYRERSWGVPYDGNAPALDQVSAAMRLAATASAFSEWLAASPFAQEVTPDELLKILNGVPQVYGADQRPQKLEWMIRQAKSLER